MPVPCVCKASLQKATVTRWGPESRWTAAERGGGVDEGGWGGGVRTDREPQQGAGLGVRVEGWREVTDKYSSRAGAQAWAAQLFGWRAFRVSEWQWQVGSGFGARARINSGRERVLSREVRTYLRVGRGHLRARQEQCRQQRQCNRYAAHPRCNEGCDKGAVR